MLRAVGMCNAGQGVNMRQVTPSHLSHPSLSAFIWILWTGIRGLVPDAWSGRIAPWGVVVSSVHIKHVDDRVQPLGWWLVMRERHGNKVWEQGSGHWADQHYARGLLYNVQCLVTSPCLCRGISGHSCSLGLQYRLHLDVTRHRSNTW